MARPPVIFIPGICGSFNLGVLLDWRGPTLNGWGFPPFIDYGKNFLASFEKAGYARDRDLFVAFYDWRKSVKDTATMYLKPWIERAKQRSGAANVVLVGHSMGGLVARSYIQSRVYAGDVAQLITLGTPHRGSAEAYYTWGGGELRSEPNVRTVFQVYLWYLRHAHPFQTELSPLQTVRTQVMSIRDLLPIDDYLVIDGAPSPISEDKMRERNLVGDLLNRPEGLENLLSRVKVTTFAGTDLPTIRGVRVKEIALAGDPPPFPDGQPVSNELQQDGDGTVLITSASLDHPAVQNTTPFTQAGHGGLQDNPAILTQIFQQIGVVSPVLGEAPPPEPKLVIMTASPVKMAVRTPPGPALSAGGVLGAAAEAGPPQRARTVRAKDHGHSGKHLNIAVIPQPAAGDYQVSLTGTATGAFALGAMLVSSEAIISLLGTTAEGDGPPLDRATPVATHGGTVAAGSEVYFTVTVSDLETTPVITLDGRRMATRAAERLRDATGGVLGASPTGGDPVEAVLGGAADPLAEADALAALAETALGGPDPELAAAIITQLKAAQG